MSCVHPSQVYIPGCWSHLGPSVPGHSDTKGVVSVLEQGPEAKGDKGHALALVELALELNPKTREQSHLKKER